MSSTCPKCGSGQIANDQCMKCGIVISKHRTDQSSSAILTSGSISFVAPAASVTPAQPAASPSDAYSWKAPSVADTAAAYHQARKRSAAQRNVFALGLLVGVLVIGYGAFHFFMQKASAFSGYYWNTRLRFSLSFPEKGWSHYRDSQMGSVPMKEVEDAFYRGGSYRTPGVLMGIWTTDSSNKYATMFDDATLAQRLADLESETATRMEQLGFQMEITDSGRTSMNTYDALVLRADLSKNDTGYKTIVFVGYSGHTSYTVQFIGKQEQMEQAADEIRDMMSTFDFRKTLM